MKKTIVFVLVCLFVASIPSHARKVRAWTYEDLAQEADLIVIATTKSVRDLKKETAFPNLFLKDKPVPAMAMEVTLDVLSVLKGKTDGGTITLSYLRPASLRLMEDGPQLIIFNPELKVRYLMYLKREPDGRYSAITGQTDPALAVKDLGLYP